MRETDQIVIQIAGHVSHGAPARGLFSVLRVPLHDGCLSSGPLSRHRSTLASSCALKLLEQQFGRLLQSCIARFLKGYAFIRK